MKKCLEPVKEITIVLGTLVTFAGILFVYGILATTCAVSNYLRCSHYKE